MMIKASGCIVTYNAVSSEKKKLDITRAIQSVYAKTKDVAFQLYVVDNASTDGTADYIASAFPDVHVIRCKENMGFGAGHNMVLDKLDSAYHFIINPDIEIRDDVISRMVSFMEQHPDVGMTTPKICFPDGRDQVVAKRNPKLKYLLASRFCKNREENKLVREYAMMDREITEPTPVENATGCFMGIRTELFQFFRGFDERYFMYFEDFDLARQVNCISKLYYLPDAVVYHVWGRESKHDFRMLWIHIRSMMKYFRKWTFFKGVYHEPGKSGGSVRHTKKEIL